MKRRRRTRTRWIGFVHKEAGKKHVFTSKDLVAALTGIKGRVFVCFGP